MAKQLSTATNPLCFGFFGVVLMSCKVNFHVVRSALRQNSMCRAWVASAGKGEDASPLTLSLNSVQGSRPISPGERGALGYFLGGYVPPRTPKLASRSEKKFP